MSALRPSALLSAAVLSVPLIAQIEHGGTPRSLERAAYPAVEYVTMHPIDVQALLAEDAMNAADKSTPYRFGWNYEVDLGLTTGGAWTDLADGSRMWRIGIACPGALSINLEFDKFNIPEGAKLFVLNNAGEFVGSFTRENDHGEHVLGVQPVHGDRIIVEYQVPAHARAGELHIDRVTHGYRDVDHMARDLGDSGSCNNNTICPEGDPWRDQIRAVAIIVVGGSALCSGTLINNCANDGTPYFLTANHCLPANLNVSTWVFRFRWESPTCSPTANGPTNMTVSGATLLAHGGGSDYGLLQLNSTPPASYNVYYSGWDKSGNTPTNTTCIHHPEGDIKKISFDHDAPQSTTYSGVQAWKILAWDDGTTEPGSSGSGLWDQNKRLVGQLYGGDATCSNDVNDNFGRLAVSFPNLQQWLGTCGNTLDGYDPNIPTLALDAQLTGITNFSGNTCIATRTPSVTVRNGGTTALTSVTLAWSLNSGAVTTQAYTINLVSGASTSIALPTMTMGSGVNTLTVTASAPNGGVDQNTANDQATATTIRGNNSVTFNLTLDRYGAETTWQVVQGATIYAQGGPYTTTTANGAYPQAPVTFCLPDGCYQLQVFDAYGDGICCNYGSGNYTLAGASGTLATGNGQFTFSVSHDFCVTGSIKVALKVLLEGPYDQAAALMRDDLRVAGRIPATEPYTGLGYAQVGGGGETVSPAVLAVTGNNAIVDWVVVELRSGAASATIVGTRSALLQRDGDVVDVDGTSPVAFTLAAGNYYVAVRHRNHLGCMTSAAVALSSSSITVDLSAAATAVYGTEPRKTVGTVRCLWAGNVFRDNALKYTGSNNDRDPILVRIGGSIPTQTATGYYLEDVNMDGSVKYTGSLNDRDPILVNIGGSVPTATRTEQLP